MTGSSQLPARFRPQRRATRARRTLLFLVGPVLWVAALLVLALVLDRSEAVEYALLVLAVSFAVGLVVLGWTRIARAREAPDL